MKKIVLSLAVAFMAFSFANAQTTPYEQGSNVLQVGLGLGGGFSTGTITMPPIQVRYDYGISDKISIGGVVGFAGSKYNWGAGNDIKYSYLLVAARGNYHFDVNVDKLDLYAGLTLGYNSVTVKDKGAFGGSVKGSGGLFGLQAGANYYLKDNLAIWADLGYGLGYLNLGVAFKF